jgi:hypothetical protein
MRIELVQEKTKDKKTLFGLKCCAAELSCLKIINNFITIKKFPKNKKMLIGNQLKLN